MRISAFAFSVCVACLVACSTQSPDTGGGCVACATNEFCCIDVCLILGSTCGSLGGSAADSGRRSDAGLPDAKVSRSDARHDTAHDANGSSADARTSETGPDAAADQASVDVQQPSDSSDAGPNRCVPLDGAATPVSTCRDATTAVDCASGGVIACNPTYQCTEWTDHASGLVNAACVPANQISVCDPLVTPSHCDGKDIRWCNKNIDPGPPGSWEVEDCTVIWASDATCVGGGDAGTLGCTSPSDVPCDPSSFAATCTSLCHGGAVASPLGGVVRPFGCAAGNQCVDNSWTGSAPNCIPSNATQSATTPTSVEVALACVGTTSITVEQYGYQWTTACPPQFETTADGSLSDVSTYCFAPPDGTAPSCITTDTVICASATVPAYCSDATHTTQCTDWIQSVQSCEWFGQTTPCDPKTNACTYPPSCHAGWPFNETCAGPDNKWTLGACTIGFATLAPCAACTPSGNGVTCS